MDSRIYFHQYRRPRYTNPTYVSDSVTTSLTFFQDKTQKLSQHQNIDYNPNPTREHSPSFNNKPHPSYSLSNYPLSITNPPHPYQTITSPTISHLRSGTQNPQRSTSINQPYTGPSNDRGNNHSHLSSYGSNSLNLNQNDIYNKQNSKMNIITMQPKDYDISIRQHPKYTLENKDQLYYKRMADEIQKKNLFDSISIERKNKHFDGNPQSSIAGKHTYGVEKEKSIAKMYTNQQKTDFNPQTLKKYNNSISASENHKPPKNFTPKLLNHMDQLISLS